MAAQIPNQPNAPVTSVIGETVVVSWRAPYNGGAVITSYLITIRQSDGMTFTEETVGCDGTDSQIVLTRQCSVTIQALISEPYSLVWGSSIYAKLTAINIMGSSQTSAAGNGAKIMRNPDAPVNLQNMYGLSNAFTLSIQWQDGAEPGGSEIIDYRIWWDQGINEMTVLEFAILEQTYTTAVPLTPGVEYTLKVQSRNEVGFSDYSETVTILAA